jgi:Spy/CpxP family protein refolding chaperone
MDPATHAAHLKETAAASATSDANAELVNQIAALRGEVAKLQAALTQGHTAQPPAAAAAAAGMAMGGKGKMQKPMGSGQTKPMQPIQPQAVPAAGGMAPMPGSQPAAGGGMGMMDMDDKMVGGMGGGGMMEGMMQKMDGMMKMMGMGDMPMGGAGSPAAMAMPSALPGFPGASHIYHIGATGFFLDHPEHITLTLEQQTALSQKKEQALLQQAQFQRRVEEAEQELWVLTAADQPDAAAIDTKVQQIAKLQGEQRIAFIRAAGEAAKVLTDEQRKQLTGMLPPVPTPMTPAPAAPAMPATPGMPDM